MNYNTKHYSLRNEIGFALMLIGVQTGTALRNVFGIELVNIIMAISVLCVANFRNGFSLRFPCWNNYFNALWIFQIIELFYSMGCEADISTYIPMHFYLMAITLSLATQNRNQEFKYADIIFFYLSAFIAFVVAYQATHGFSGVYTTNEFYREDIGTSQMEAGGDKITMGRALLFSIICSLVYKPRFKVENIIRLIVIAAAFIGLMMFNTRASMIVSLVCVVVYFIKKVQIETGHSLLKGNNLYRISWYIILAFVLLLGTYFSIDYVHEMVNKLFENFNRGVLTFWGNNSLGVDQSTLYRHQVITKILNTPISFSNLLFGMGYYTIYIDIPIFQAFYDFGIFGLLYLYLLGYKPAKLIYKLNSIKTPIVIVLLFSIQYLFDQLYCGLPYMFFQFIPIILLVFFYHNNKNNYVLNSRK